MKVHTHRPTCWVTTFTTRVNPVGTTTRGRIATTTSRRFFVRASDDEDMVPILSGRMKKGFTEKEYAQLKNPKLLGGKTIGEELSMLRQEYLSAEERARDQSHHEFSSDNWQGDVYIGSQWNTLSVLYGIMMLSILGGLAGAYFSYGHLWGVTPGLW